MPSDAPLAHFRPNRRVLSALREVRAQGLARRLGTLDPALVTRISQAARGLEGQADDSYVDDVAVHWRRAGFSMAEGDKDTPYTRSLRRNVAIAKATTEDGAILPGLAGGELAAALAQWRAAISRYAHDLSLTRINFLRPGGHVLEHVDPPDQNMIQCLISGETTFDFRAADGRRSFRMQIGDIWWFNTTWPHSTRNDSHETRILLHTRGSLAPELLAGAPEAEPTEFVPKPP